MGTINTLKLEGCGDLILEFGDFRSLGGEATKEFLSRIIKNSIKRASEYCRKSEFGNDHIDIYTEQQLHTIICPAIADVTHNKFMFEHPSMRKLRGVKPYAGHIDYWASYKHISYLIELKHAYCTYNQTEPRHEIENKLITATNQLNSTKNTFSKSYFANDKAFYGLAFEWITFRKRNSDKKQLAKSDTNLVKESYMKLKNDSGSQAELHALWIIDERLTKPVNFVDRHNKDYFMKFPAVAFLVKIPY